MGLHAATRRLGDPMPVKITLDGLVTATRTVHAPREDNDLDCQRSSKRKGPPSGGPLGRICEQKKI